VAILTRSLGPLLLFACAWKIATELLYPVSGAPWWEFVERGGSYTAPLALFLIQRAQGRVAEPGNIVPALTPAAMALGVALLLAAPAPARAGAMAPDVAPASAARDSAGSRLTAADTARIDVRFTSLPDSTLVRMLRGGGYVLAFRHGSTDWTQRDSDLMNYADRSTQRNLGEEGRADATKIGKAIAALRIPIGDVRSSPFWRCRDTATLAFGHVDTTSALFTKSLAYRRIRWALLSSPPRKGTNTVLVTHQDALMPLTTLKRDELKEGSALVIQPLGDAGFRVVAQLSPADWARLAGGGAEPGSGAKAPSH
jgi:phosphohistidine phosphatase SixA